MTQPLLPWARPCWDGGLPRDPESGDVYFSHYDPLGEREAVFLRQGRLRELVMERRRPVVAEVGLGGALTALLSLRLFLEVGGAESHLVYLALERRPWPLAELRRLWARWPSLARLGERLAAVYPPPLPGIHRRRLFAGRVTFLFAWGEAQDLLRDWDAGAGVDLWYLDGFAPACDDRAWSPELFRLIARHSAPGSRFTTYTAAGRVRRGLEAVGFAVEKRPGFAGKRDSLCGVSLRGGRRVVERPWFARPHPGPHREAVVVGAGIAGCCLADELALRGWRVRLLDTAPAPASGASGNPVGLLQPRAGVAGQALQLPQRLHVEAFLWAVSRYRDYGWRPGGLLQLQPQRELERLHPLALGERLSLDEASLLAGVTLPQGGVWWPQGGTVDPRRLCRALSSRPGVDFRPHSPVGRMFHRDGLWHVVHRDGTICARAPVVVLTNAAAARRLRPELPLSAVRGQLALLAADERTGRLQHALCGRGCYLTPPQRGWQVLGASFEPGRGEGRLDAAVQRGLTASLEALLPGAGRSGAPLRGRVAWRAITPDRRPLIGPLVEPMIFDAVYHDLRHGRSPSRYPEAPYVPGLYALTGLGAHGLIFAPWGAALLADLLEGAPLGTNRSAMEAVHPARFRVRALRRGERDGL